MNKKLFALLFTFLYGMDLCRGNVFWHLSDNHMQADYVIGSSVDQKCVSGKGKAGKFGDYNCRSPYTVELSAVNSLNSLSSKKPTFILYTGDYGASFGNQHTQATSTKLLKNATKLLERAKTLTGAKIFPLLGNHDTNPEHCYKATNFWLYETAGDLWAQFLTAGALKTFKKGGYYTELIHKGLRLIALNTNLYYNRNTLVDLKSNDPGGQLAWFKEQLQKARNNSEKVYIAGHVPPGNLSSTENFHRHFNKPFLNAMSGYHDIIIASFWGHLHVEWWSFIGNPDGGAGKYHPAFLTSTLASKTNSDPSFRLFEYDNKTFSVLDYTTFYMNLAASNKAGKITWKKMYSAAKDYGLKDLSGPSMLSEYNKMKKNATEFNRVYKRRKANTAACSGTCKKKALCAMLYTDVTKYESCIK